MINVEEILKIEMQSIADDLKKKHVELGMKASGKWTKSVEASSTPLTGSVWAEDYTEYLADGRGPTKNAGSGEPLIEKIKRWIVDKGIRADIPLNSLAYLITRKIHKEGTKYYKQGGTDLLSAVITPKRVQSIIDKIGVNAIKELTLNISRTIKNVA